MYFSVAYLNSTNEKADLKWQKQQGPNIDQNLQIKSSTPTAQMESFEL